MPTRAISKTEAAPAAAPDKDAAKRWVARQPIFDRQRETYGYELLFRGPWRPAEDGARATAHVINEMVNVIGMRNLLDGRIGFVNLTRQMLLNGDYQLLPSKSVVIELLEDVPADSDVIAACHRLKDRGYRLALDDFMDDGDDYRPLVEMADIIKIDFLGTSRARRRQIVESLKRPGLEWLAEKVETHDHFDEAVNMLNCSLIQGFFFCEPLPVRGNEIPSNKQNYMRLVHAVNDMDFDMARIEEIVRRELSLSVKLLKFLNSAALGLPNKIESIRQALSLLGERPLRKWAALAAMTCVGEDKPAELLRFTLTRAQFCEQIARTGKINCKDVDMFLLGLLSTVEALLDRPLDDLLLDMPVSTGLKAALLGGGAPAGTILKLAIACERGEAESATVLINDLGLDEGAVYECWHQAVAWSSQVG